MFLSSRNTKKNIQLNHPNVRNVCDARRSATLLSHVWVPKVSRRDASDSDYVDDSSFYIDMIAKDVNQGGDIPYSTATYICSNSGNTIHEALEIRKVQIFNLSAPEFYI